MVIEFPRGILSGSGMSVALVVFRRGRKKTSVYMVSLAGREGRKWFRFDTRLRDLCIPDMESLSFLIRERETAEGLSKTVTVGEIERNRYCFGPSAYIEEDFIVQGQELSELFAEKKELQEELSEADVEYEEAVNRYIDLKAQWRKRDER